MSQRSRSQQAAHRRQAGYRGSSMDSRLDTMHPVGQGGLGAFDPADAHRSLSLHPPLERQGFLGDNGPLAEQVSALQDENARLRRANQALSVASEHGPSGLDARRKQLVELLLSLVDPQVAPTGGEPPAPESGPQPSRPTSPSRLRSVRRARESPVPSQQCDWDGDALLAVANQGMVAPAEAGGDRYAAESRKAIGSVCSYVASPQAEQLDNQPQQRQAWRRHRASLSSVSSVRSGPAPRGGGSIRSRRARPSKDASGYSGVYERPGAMETPWYAPPLHDDKPAKLAAALLGHGPAQFTQDPAARLMLYSPSAGTFQAPTLDALRSGNMTLADIIEASSKSMSLDQLRRHRMTEAKPSVGDGNEDGSGDELHMAACGPAEEKHPQPSAAGQGNGCFWLDITDPAPDEMASLARVFGIHPLTVEDILARDDGRDKCEMFGGYCFLAYRTIDYGEGAQSNYEFNRGSEGIATAGFAVVLKQSCVLTFHHTRELGHVSTVIDRLRGLAPATASPAYIAYALIDDITDTLGPEMRSVELEVDAVDELVLILSTNEQVDMLRRIGATRRRILSLWRLLQGKPDVIRAFTKLMERQAVADGTRTALPDESVPDAPTRETTATTILEAAPAPLPRSSQSGTAIPQLAARTRAIAQWPACITGGYTRDKQRPSAHPSAVELGVLDSAGSEDPVTADEVAHYLSDVYDHLVALVGSSSHCDMVLARAHSNYLARISLALGESTMGTNQLATQMTVLAGIFLPLTLVAGVFGMNVHVPGQDLDNLYYFWAITGGMLACVVATLVICRWRGVL
ncbi:CorA metal ion transporter [Coemansia helicoidea]|uniref:CorA metal ion transporter n=1 Tax=Coemansia helicoidea TaxID=1286919 RepID=A0ACC1LF63_9FUNG|nr:CorA metal ion transporter [Coemansia helicoidea]